MRIKNKTKVKRHAPFSALSLSTATFHSSPALLFFLNVHFYRLWFSHFYRLWFSKYMSNRIVKAGCILSNLHLHRLWLILVNVHLDCGKRLWFSKINVNLDCGTGLFSKCQPPLLNSTEMCTSWPIFVNFNIAHNIIMQLPTCPVNDHYHTREYHLQRSDGI